jgi:hypothetical protein
MSKNNVKRNSDRAPRQDHTKFGGDRSVHIGRKDYTPERDPFLYTVVELPPPRFEGCLSSGMSISEGD